MKFSWIILTFAISITPIAANANDNCASTAKIAISIMKARQAGADLSEMMEAPKKTCQKDMSPAACSALVDLLQKITIQAYEISRYNSKEIQDKVIQDFGNDYYLNCYKSKK